MSTRIDRYWSDTFGLSPGFVQHEGILVVPYVKPRGDNSAYVFVCDRVGVVVVEAPLVEPLRQRVGGVSVETLLDLDVLQSLFDARICRTVGPAFQGYVEAEEFHPCLSDRVCELRSGDENRLERLRVACDPVEWEHSGVKWKPGLLGYLVDDEIVAVAHHILWAPHVANIGVITHPAHRGRGYGKAVVSAAMRQALDRGYLVVYQTLLDNVASVALARHLGCRMYARTIRVYLQARPEGSTGSSRSHIDEPVCLVV